MFNVQWFGGFSKTIIRSRHDHEMKRSLPTNNIFLSDVEKMQSKKSQPPIDSKIQLDALLI